VWSVQQAAFAPVEDSLLSPTLVPRALAAIISFGGGVPTIHTAYDFYERIL
jgi:hypothetical protein